MIQSHHPLPDLGPEVSLGHLAIVGKRGKTNEAEEQAHEQRKSSSMPASGQKESTNEYQQQLFEQSR